MVNIRPCAIIAKILASQQTGIIVTHPYFSLLHFIKAIVIVLFDAPPAAKIMMVFTPTFIQTAFRASISTGNVTISRTPDMASSTLPSRLCHNIFRERAKPSKSMKNCEIPIIVFDKSSFIPIAFWATASSRNMTIGCIPSMALSTLPLCLRISVLRKGANPDKPPLLGKFKIVGFEKPDARWTSAPARRNCIVFRIPNMPTSALPSSMRSGIFGKGANPDKSSGFCEFNIVLFRMFLAHIKRYLLSAASCLDMAVTVGTDSIIHRFPTMSRRNNCTISRGFVNQVI